MTKLLVINSFGPMASTLLSGLIEKFGYTNTPIRKLGLHQYLLGIHNLKSGYMEARLKQILKQHSMLGLRGGISVLDRNNQKPKALTDINKVKDKLENINANNVQDLYFQCRNIYSDAVIYKDIQSHKDWQIELTTDIHRFDHKTLYRAYKNNFDDVHMIHLHRDFSGWINSLASQAFVHPELKQNIKFFPHMRYADYALYEEAVAAMPGLNIEFDDLFDTPIEKLSKNISNFIGVDIPKENLRKASFDMYGKIIHYENAFKRFDDNITYLSKPTQKYFTKLANNKKIQKPPYNLITWLIYLVEMIKYRIKNR